MSYDSTKETSAHIKKVRSYIFRITDNLAWRAIDHDASKLGPKEKPLFDEWTPRLREMEYGSPEYQASLDALKPALDHHYAANDHHPEHFENGMDDMNLVQLVELLCDWKAAGERTKNGDLRKSIEMNQARFGYSDDIKRLLLNSVRLLEPEDE